MKRFYYGSAILLFLTMMLYQSTSFSSLEMMNKATVSAVSNGQALLSIQYGDGRVFWITNNTENTIRIENNGGMQPLESFYIGPGRSGVFSIIGAPEEFFNGSVIVVDAEWEDGYATIESPIPEANIETILMELLDEEEDGVREEVEGGESSPLIEEQEAKAKENMEVEELERIDETGEQAVEVEK